jgi:hypothetical protein
MQFEICDIALRLERLQKRTGAGEFEVRCAAAKIRG